MSTQRSPQPSGNKWPMTALMLILGALFLTRGGMASLVPMARLLAPVIAAVVVYRIIRNYVRAQLMRGPERSRMDPFTPPAASSAVIDLCPKCGSYLSPGHRCAPKA